MGGEKTPPGNLKTILDKVEWVLEHYEDARNSDMFCIIVTIRKFYPELGRYIQFIPYDVIKKYDGLFESIRRARQYIQNTLGKYPPTDPKVRKRRRIAEQAYREKYGRRG